MRLVTRVNEVFYIGLSNNPHKRLKQHISASLIGQRDESSIRIFEIVNDGYQPELSILGVTWSSEGPRLEQEWIERFSELTCLCNVRKMNVSFSPSEHRQIDDLARLSGLSKQRFVQNVVKQYLERK